MKKQIKKSFFNPILHFLPLLLFLVLDEFYGIGIVWKLVFSITVLAIMALYVYFTSKSVFKWNLFFTTILLGVGLISCWISLLVSSFYILDKIIIFVFFLLLLLFRDKIQQFILRRTPTFLPMANNFNEFYRVIWMLFFVLFFYILLFYLLKPFDNDSIMYTHYLSNLFVGVIIFVAVYESLRVYIIRANLITEEWWPIVSDQGKIIGSIEHFTSLTDEKKYLHPIVRLLLIDKGMIFLQKRASDDLISPDLWDTAISNHVKMGENIEQCVDRTRAEQFRLNDFKYMHLSNYTLENEHEIHYAFLFVSCQQSELDLQPLSLNATKWWTQQQIEDNLHSGIFSKNFLLEFDLLQRSGLLETGKCDCRCRLKDAIFEQSGIIKKD